MTFTRGDIVRLRSDEQEAERCESESSREYHRSRRYIVLGQVEPGARFRLPNGNEVRRHPTYEVWSVPYYGTWIVPMLVRESDLIATGERAEEIA